MKWTKRKKTENMVTTKKWCPCCLVTEMKMKTLSEKREYLYDNIYKMSFLCGTGILKILLVLSLFA